MSPLGLTSATKATERCILHSATLLYTQILWITFSDSSVSGGSDSSNRANTPFSARDLSGTWLNFQRSRFVIWLPQLLFQLGCPLQQRNLLLLRGLLETMGNSIGILLLK